jgi:hypothetical protein
VIGKWFKRLEMKASDVMWGSNIGTFGSSFLPTSRCSEPCGPGAVKKMTEVDFKLLTDRLYTTNRYTSQN